MEWTIVTVIIALVGLFLTVGTPILKLNSNIVKLNTSLDALQKRTDKQDEELKTMKNHAHESHKRLWDHNEEQDKAIAEHGQAIAKLGGRVDSLEKKL